MLQGFCRYRPAADIFQWELCVRGVHSDIPAPDSGVLFPCDGMDAANDYVDIICAPGTPVPDTAAKVLGAILYVGQCVDWYLTCDQFLLHVQRHGKCL